MKLDFGKLKKIYHCDVRSTKGKVSVKLRHKSCFNYRCPTCYLSWAVREAHRIADKLEAIRLKFPVGDVEHLVLSVPEKDYLDVELNFDRFLVKVRRALESRFVVGGKLIFHGFRYADFEEAREKGVPFGWRWSPHFHILGFIQKQKMFAAVPKMFLEDGFVLNLKDKRKTVFGTAWYQLNHASYRSDVERFQISRGFGIDKTSKIKVPKVDHKSECPICGHEYVRLRYLGVDNRIKRDSCDCGVGERHFLSDWLDVDGNLLWHEDMRESRFG